MNRSILTTLVAGLALACACGGGAGDSLYLLDLDGRRVDPFGEATPATVFLFTRSDCPISNRYAPQVQRLHAEFAARDVRFWLVYPDPDEPIEAIRKHIEQYGYAIEALRDPRHTLVRRTQARVTPEAAVFTDAAQMVYRGRIDDRFVAFGKTRAAATSHDLQDALIATLEGRRVEPPTTTAVGCYIPSLE